MHDRAEFLRRRIALYRSYLRDGANAELAQQYLASLINDEKELAAIEGRDDEPKSR